MVSLEVIAILLSGISISASLFYYANVLQNANKTQKQQLETRQTQLLMELYETFRSPTFRTQWDDMLWRMEWDDYEDFLRKYHADTNSKERTSWFSVATYFEGVGVLVKRNLIDLAIVEDLLGYSIKQAWERIGPIETQSRKHFNAPRLFDDFILTYP